MPVVAHAGEEVVFVLVPLVVIGLFVWLGRRGGPDR
ncbi:hypothetical protein BH20ACT9_BH20ACT9_13050 [soil metagenome]